MNFKLLLFQDGYGSNPLCLKIRPVAALAKIATNLLPRLSIKDDKKKLNKKRTQANRGETTFCSSFLPLKFFAQFLLLQEALNTKASCLFIVCSAALLSRPRMLNVKLIWMVNNDYVMLFRMFWVRLWTEREEQQHLYLTGVLKSDWNSRTAAQWNERGH
jgi:hypothetical protein